jgi:hypothetical protein
MRPKEFKFVWCSRPQRARKLRYIVNPFGDCMTCLQRGAQFLHFNQDCIQLGKQRCISRILHNRLYRHLLSPNLPCRDSNTLNADKLVAGDRLFNFQA